MYKKNFEDGMGMARTLNANEVAGGTLDLDGEHYTKTHESGWTITAKVHNDYYEWVNLFIATSPLGVVVGDFESKVVASSKEAYDHFVYYHPYEEWDYQDI